MRKYRLLNILLLAILIAVTLVGCGQKEVKTDSVNADSLLNVAHKGHQYERLLELADTLQATGHITGIRADYWRGYSYSRQGLMRLAEKYWKEAVNSEIHNQEDLTYYAKSANRLSGELLLRGEYEATMKVAVSALKKLDEAQYQTNSDYAYLQAAVGCCQLKMGSIDEAIVNFNQAYNLFYDVVEEDPCRPNFTTAIAGIITITEAYIQANRFHEAYEWTEKFRKLLDYYKQTPNPVPNFIDKQQARLNIYTASALEGLGRHAEAEKAYQEAKKSNYVQTNEGKVEAISYLMVAGRWDEAADNYEVLDKQMEKFNINPSMDIIQQYLLPKYRANLSAHRTETANAVSRQICDKLDSAINIMHRDAAMELTTIYNMQQKEREIAEHKSSLVRQRYIAMVISLALTIFCFVLIIYFRHQSSMRLEKAYCRLEEANERTKESSRMKTSFIQQMSHEIRTPLNILSGFTQILTSPDMEFDEKTHEMYVSRFYESLGVTLQDIKDNTGFDIDTSRAVPFELPTEEELEVLRRIDKDKVFIG